MFIQRLKLFRIATSVLPWLNRVGATLGMLGIIMMMLLMVVEVVGRKFFNYSTLVADELIGYLLVLVLYMGLAYTRAEGGHIQIGVVTDRLSRRGRDWLVFVQCLLGLGFTVLITYNSLQLVLQSYRIGAVSTTLLLTPLYLPQAIVFVGLSLFLLQLMVYFILAVKAVFTRGDVI